MKERSESEKNERARIRWLSRRQSADEMRVMPGYQTHEHLLQIVKQLPTDVAPWGKTEVGTFGDCSSGCRWYHVLAGRLGSMPPVTILLVVQTSLAVARTGHECRLTSDIRLWAFCLLARRAALSQLNPRHTV
jgi:hypothetical protein